MLSIIDRFQAIVLVIIAGVMAMALAEEKQLVSVGKKCFFFFFYKSPFLAGNGQSIHNTLSQPWNSFILIIITLVLWTEWLEIIKKTRTLMIFRPWFGCIVTGMVGWPALWGPSAMEHRAPLPGPLMDSTFDCSNLILMNIRLGFFSRCGDRDYRPPHCVDGLRRFLAQIHFIVVLPGHCLSLFGNAASFSKTKWAICAKPTKKTLQPCFGNSNKPICPTRCWTF